MLAVESCTKHLILGPLCRMQCGESMWKKQSCSLTGAARFMRVARCARSPINLYPVVYAHLELTRILCLKVHSAENSCQSMCIHPCTM